MSDRTTPLHQPVATARKESLVAWPHVIVSENERDDDLGPPLEQLLIDIGLKGTQQGEDEAGNASTAVKGLPVSVSIIEAGATAASKAWAAAIGVLGGGTAVWAAVTDFWSGQPAQTRGALVIAAAIIVAACALAAALIMYGDVRARGQGAAAQYYARASVASAFLRGATSIGSEPGDANSAGLNGHKAGAHKKVPSNPKW